MAQPSKRAVLAAVGVLALAGAAGFYYVEQANEARDEAHRRAHLAYLALSFSCRAHVDLEWAGVRPGELADWKAEADKQGVDPMELFALYSAKSCSPSQGGN